MDVREVAEMLETAEAAGVAQCAEVHGHRVHGVGRARLIDAGAGNPLTRAYGMGFDGPVDPDRVADAVAFFRETGCTPRAELCPFAHPTLRVALRAHGFAVEKFKDVLARELPDGEAFPEPAEGVTVARVGGSGAERAAVASTIAEGFGDGEGGATLMRQLMDQPAATAFAARVGGELAGGGIMAISGPTVALFGASTLPQYRRRGVQIALIRARIAEGRAQGAQVASIQAEPGIATRRNAERAGFWLAYTRATCIA